MTRALVLSGGGPVGIAWQTGLAAGLARRGVALADADFVVGTSAGSAVGAHIAAGLDLEERLARYQAQRAAASTARGEPSPGEAPRSAPPPERLAKLMEIMAKAQAEADEEVGRALIGRFALDAETAPEERFLASFDELAGVPWPENYACTAVDAETGAFVVWDVKADVPLHRAVASSCSVPGIFPPVTLNGRRYIDGGMRSATNADLALGHDKVLLVTLIDPERLASATDPRSVRYRKRIEQELAQLEDGGAQVLTVGPDAQAAAVIGVNLMNGALSPPAAAEGVRQGEADADRVGAFWS